MGLYLDRPVILKILFTKYLQNFFYPSNKTNIKWGWFLKEKDFMKLRI